MRKANLEKSLVLYMIEVYFHDKTTEKEEVLKYVQSMNLCNNQLYGKIMFKFYKVKMIRFAIDTVLAHVAEIKRKSFYYRYKEKMEWVGISMRLYISVAQLTTWNQEIVQMIADFTALRVRANDVFHLQKIWALLEFVDEQIEVLSVPPYSSFADQRYIHKLKIKRQQVLYLFVLISDYVSTLENPKEREIVLEKLKYPQIQQREIAVSCGVSISLVGTYLAKYKSKIMKLFRKREVFSK